MEMKRYLIIPILLLCGCQTPSQSAAKLQSHLAGAKTASDKTGAGIHAVRGRLETIDYKSGRAKKLLDQGVDQP